MKAVAEIKTKEVTSTLTQQGKTLKKRSNSCFDKEKPGTIQKKRHQQRELLNSPTISKLIRYEICKLTTELVAEISLK